MKSWIFLAAEAFFTASCLAGEVAVQLKTIDNRTYEVDGRFTALAPRRAAWETLTDYDHIADWVSSMRASRVQERGPDRILVEQDASGQFLLFSRHARVLLEVRETPLRRIDFTDALLKDFVSYSGSWEIAESSGGVLVTYRLSAEPRLAAPSFVKKRILKRSIQNLLNEVRAEILRRSATSSPNDGQSVASKKE